MTARRMRRAEGGHAIARGSATRGDVAMGGSAFDADDAFTR
jgi:hypothetical protein